MTQPIFGASQYQLKASSGRVDTAAIAFSGSIIHSKQGRQVCPIVLMALMVGREYFHQDTWETLGNPYALSGRASLTMIGQ